jgi:hypothetical protein
MLLRFVISMMLFATAALADVCSYVTKEQAELGARLLRINPNFVKYCAPCSDKSKTKVRAEKVEAHAVGNDQYWGVFVNAENIDLAYSYLDIGEKNGISLANLSGCQTPYDVPRMIDITDVAAAAKPEVRPVQPEPKPVQPEVTPAQPEVKTPEPEPMPAQLEPKPSQPETKPVQPESKQNLEMQKTTSEDDVLAQADQYFKKADFAAAVRLYEELLEKDLSKSGMLTPKITKCYYNLGVQTIRKATLGGSKKDCIRAADYFTQTLLLDQNDTHASDALKTARMCKELGPNLPRIQDEIDDLELRK